MITLHALGIGALALGVLGERAKARVGADLMQVEDELQRLQDDAFEAGWGGEAEHAAACARLPDSLWHLENERERALLDELERELSEHGRVTDSAALAYLREQEPGLARWLAALAPVGRESTPAGEVEEDAPLPAPTAYGIPSWRAAVVLALASASGSPRCAAVWERVMVATQTRARCGRHYGLFDWAVALRRGARVMVGCEDASEATVRRLREAARRPMPAGSFAALDHSWIAERWLEPIPIELGSVSWVDALRLEPQWREWLAETREFVRQGAACSAVDRLPHAAAAQRCWAERELALRALARRSLVMVASALAIRRAGGDCGPAVRSIDPFTGEAFACRREAGRTFLEAPPLPPDLRALFMREQRDALLLQHPEILEF